MKIRIKVRNYLGKNQFLIYIFCNIAKKEEKWPWFVKKSIEVSKAPESFKGDTNFPAYKPVSLGFSVASKMGLPG